MVRQRAVALAWAAEDVRVVPALGHDLHEPTRVTKGIEVDRRRGLGAELVSEVLPAREDLSDEGLARRHVAVRLEKPAAHDVPLLLLHEPLDPSEQSRLVLLDPLVEHRLVVVEHKAVVGLAQLRSRSERRDHLRRAFLPLPQPDGVQVCVTDQMDRFLHGLAS